MTAPSSVGGIVCDVAAMIAVVADHIAGRDGAGRDLYERARAEGTTLAVPVIVANRAAFYCHSRGDARAGMLLAAWLYPERFREPGDPVRAAGPRGVWQIRRRPPSQMPSYAKMLEAVDGDPVTAYVAAYAAELGWPVATDNPGLYAELLGRDDAIVVPSPA